MAYCVLCQEGHEMNETCLKKVVCKCGELGHLRMKCSMYQSTTCNTVGSSGGTFYTDEKTADMDCRDESYIDKTKRKRNHSEELFTAATNSGEFDEIKEKKIKMPISVTGITKDFCSLSSNHILPPKTEMKRIKPKEEIPEIVITGLNSNIVWIFRNDCVLCPMCTNGKTYVKYANLSNHLRRVHKKNKAEVSGSCDMCWDVVGASGLLMHVKNKHPEHTNKECGSKQSKLSSQKYKLKKLNNLAAFHSVETNNGLLAPLKPPATFTRVNMQVFDLFKNFCLTKHSGRILTLLPTAGTVDLNALFFGRKKGEGKEEHAIGVINVDGKARKHILCVNMYQMVLLLMFNTKEKVTYKEMMEKTLIPARDLIKALQPLSVHKTSQRILLKIPKTKEIESSHVFSVNEAFTSKFHRLKIQQVNQRRGEAELERSLTRKKDRKHEIEACIVRIMKRRKQLNHHQLVSKVVDQLNNKPSILLINEQVEGLIEREYMVRSDQDRELYIYIV